MDDLLHFLSNEIAMDGDEGTPVNRLDSFLDVYYERKAKETHASAYASTSVTKQNIDQAFKEFVWKQLLSLPQLKVAFLKPVENEMPTEPHAEEFAAERVSEDEAMKDLDQGEYNLKHKAKIKAALQDKGKKIRDARLNHAPDGVTEMQLCELDKDHLQGTSREDLLSRYGPDNVRLAADPESCYVALTGSHVRHSKLTHLSYQILQAISRGREDGKTVVDLGREFAHDQKSLFHFVKNLVELNLIVKFKVIQGRMQTSRCISRHYLDNSPHWHLWVARDPEEASAARQTEDNDEQEDEDGLSQQLIFLTIAHLYNNEPLVRSRIINALRKAPENTLPHAEIVFSIGFQSRPSPLDRRRLNRVIANMANEGFIEKVGAVGEKGTISCIRLPETAGDAAQGRSNDPMVIKSRPEERPNYLMTVPVEKQIIDLIIGAGPRGLTMREIRVALGDINYRTLETILARYEKFPLPPHLCDFRIQGVLETEGREKRLRWFSVAGYHARCRLDGLVDLPDKRDFSCPDRAGEFSALDTCGFYSNPAAWFEYAETQFVTSEEGSKKRKKAKANAKVKAVKKSAMPASVDDSAETVVAKERKRKAKVVDSEDHDGSTQPLKRSASSAKKVKGAAMVEAEAGPVTDVGVEVPKVERRGRPRKYPPGTTSYQRKLLMEAAKRQAALELALEDVTGETVVQKAADVPLTYNDETQSTPEGVGSLPTGQSSDTQIADPASVQPLVPRKRGRPRKSENLPIAVSAELSQLEKTPSVSGSVQDITPSSEPSPVVPRKRGRPRKSETVPTVMPTESSQLEGTTIISGATQEATPPLQPNLAMPKKRGRPRKGEVGPTALQAEAPQLGGVQVLPGKVQELTAHVEPSPVIPRKRGRPRKGETRMEAAPHEVTMKSNGSQSTDIQVPGETPVENVPLSSRTEKDITDPFVKTSQDIKILTEIAKTLEEAPQSNFTATTEEVHRFTEPVLASGDGAENTPGDHAFGPGVMVNTDAQAQAAAHPRTSSNTTDPSSTPKRIDKERVSVDTPASKPKLTSKAPERRNYSLFKQENEFIAVLKNAGGIVEDGQAFIKMWMEYKTQRHPLGKEPPMVDRRTYTAIMNGLEARGVLKRSALQVQAPHGKFSTRNVVYFADIELGSQQMRSFIESFQQRLSGSNMGKGWLDGRKTVDLPESLRRSYGSQQIAYSQPPSDADPHTFFLSEWRIVSQLYGWQYGPYARAQTLHEFLVRNIVDENDSDSIVSSDPGMRMFALPFVTADMPFSAFQRLIPCAQQSDSLDEYLTSADVSNVPARNLPVPIAKLYGVGRPKNDLRFQALFDILVSFRLVVPMQQVAEKTDFMIYSGPEREPRYFRPCQTKKAVYWMLANKAPLYQLREKLASARALLGELPVQNTEQATFFWETVHNLLFAASPPDHFPQVTAPYPPVFEANQKTLKTLKNPSKWQATYYLLSHQREYIRNIVRELPSSEDLLDDVESLKKLSHNVGAPMATVRDFVERGSPLLDGSSARKRNIKVRRVTSTQSDGQETPIASQEGPREVLARKARQALSDKEKVWQGIFNLFIAENGADAFAQEQFEYLHNWYMSPNGLTARDLQKHLDEMAANARQKETFPAPPSHLPAGVSTFKTQRAGLGRLAAPTPTAYTAALPQIPPPVGDLAVIDVVSDGTRKTASQGWNEAEDEQLRDFYVIIQARAAYLGVRFSIEACKPFYPGCTNKVLLDRLRRLATVFGDASYLDALQEEWTKIWLEYRGSRLLPENDLNSLNGFGIGLHRRVLCSMIDKHTLRHQHKTPEDPLSRLQLPKNPTDLQELYAVSQKKTLSRWDSPETFEFLYSTTTAQLRGKEFNSRPFATRHSIEWLQRFSCTSEERQALYSQRYDFNATLPQRIQEEAKSFEQQLASAKETDWSLVAEDGDMAALIHLFSSDLLDLNLDTSVTLEGRPYTDYRTRKTDDENFENDLSIKLRDTYDMLDAPLFS